MKKTVKKILRNVLKHIFTSTKLQSPTQKTVNILEALDISARLAQSVERETFNLKAKGSSPLSGEFFLFLFNINTNNLLG